MTKIYISKSNNSNLDDVIQVRSMFKNIPEKATRILEHTGGSYNPDLILLADIIIVVPDLSTLKDNRIVTVGKGLYTEATTNRPTYIWTGSDFKIPKEWERIPGDSWVEYGRIACATQSHTLNSILDITKPSGTPTENKSKSSDNNYKYLIEE